VASYLSDGPTVEVPAELFDAPWQLVKGIPDSALGDHVRKNGIIRIQRKWIENSLPNYELLDAVALAYGNLSQMLDDAHRQTGLPGMFSINIETKDVLNRNPADGRLECMVGHSDARTLNVRLADGCPISVSTVHRALDIEAAAKSAERYALDPKDMLSGHDNVELTLQSFFKAATVMFLKDKYHQSMVFLLKGGVPIDIIGIAPADHAEKYLLMRNISQRVIRNGADGVMMIGEAWGAKFDKVKPYQRAVDAPDREELLVANLVTKQGQTKQRLATILREGDSVALSEPREDDGGAPFIFAPFFVAWGLPVPPEWLREMSKVEAQHNF
jgi:hypothetical protein